MAFKTVKKITNPKKKKGDQTLGKLYPTNGKTKVFVPQYQGDVPL